MTHIKLYRSDGGISDMYLLVEATAENIDKEIKSWEETNKNSHDLLKNVHVIRYELIS